MIQKILEGDFGKKIDKEVQSKFGNFSVLNIGSYNEKLNLIMGSNPFYVVAVNQVLRDNGLKIRTATQANLEQMPESEKMNKDRIYIDTALVLRYKEGPKGYLSRDLANQLFNFKGLEQKMPAMISLRGLELKRDAYSEYGLSFKIGDEVETFYAPIFNGPSGQFSSKDIDEKTGLPKKLENGNQRILHTNNSCLSRLLSVGPNLESREDNLKTYWQNNAGRVVLIGDEIPTDLK